MAKKAFLGGLNSLLEQTKENKPLKTETEETKIASIHLHEAPTNNALSNAATIFNKGANYHGVRAGAKRKTFIVDEELSDIILAIAYYERMHVGEVVDAAFSHYLKTFDEATLKQAKTSYKNRKKK